MVEGGHEYGLVDEDGWKLVRVPIGFEEALVHLHGTLKEKAPRMAKDGSNMALREMYFEHAEEMIQLALEAHDLSETSHAWYFLTELAKCVGFLVASEGAIYPRGDDTDLRSSLSKAGSKGGRAKGENAHKVLESIAQKILLKQTPKGGWTKNLMRKEYNHVTAELTDYKDADRKWRALLKRDEIQGALAKPSSE